VRNGGDWYDISNQPLYRGANTWSSYGLRGERLETDTFTYGTYQHNGQLTGVYGIVNQGPQNIYFGGRLIQSNGATVATDRLGS
jgi:hypothetical protein